MARRATRSRRPKQFCPREADAARQASKISWPEGADGAVLEAACGIGALVEAGLIRRLPGESHHEAACSELGRPYAEGFDGQTMPHERWSRGPDRGRMLEGHHDGQALWAAVRDGVSSPVPDCRLDRHRRSRPRQDRAGFDK
jgi:hypothetical protein